MHILRPLSQGVITRPYIRKIKQPLPSISALRESVRFVTDVHNQARYASEAAKKENLVQDVKQQRKEGLEFTKTYKKYRRREAIEDSYVDEVRLYLKSVNI